MNTLAAHTVPDCHGSVTATSQQVSVYTTFANASWMAVKSLVANINGFNVGQFIQVIATFASRKLKRAILGLDSSVLDSGLVAGEHIGNQRFFQLLLSCFSPFLIRVVLNANALGIKGIIGGVGSKIT